MKKIYTIVAAITFTAAANAQTRANLDLPQLGKSPVIHTEASARVLGDTLFYFDGSNFYGTGISSTSVPAFNYANDDVDGLTANAAMTPWIPVSDWKFFYDLNSVTADTNSFIGATSWFASGTQSDDWFSVGPIAIPAAGANLSWKHNIPDGDWRDGYKVFVSITGLANYTDFTDAAIFTVADSDPTTAGDTVNTPDNVWYPRSTSLAAYAGQSIFIGFQHYSNDKFILYMDDILVTEGPAGVAEFVNGAKLLQNMPNPTNGVTAINYELEKNATVALSVYDITGKKVAGQNEGEQNTGKHSINFNSNELAAGVYTYSLTVGQNTTSTMKMVVVK